MIKKKIKIALALSGGGTRAAVFHLGVLKRLAESSLLENVTDISTVSGGSIITGLIYKIAGNRWPDSNTFNNTIVKEAKRLLIKKSIQGNYIRKTLIKIFTEGLNIFSYEVSDAD